jgi:hypothetical protein
MDENGTAPVNERYFALPLCLLSLIFFSFYVIIIDWIFSGQIQYLLTLVLPATLANSIVSSRLTIEIIVCILSLIGAIQIVREMKRQSFAWKTGLPLCFVIGVIMVSAIVIPFISLLNVQQFSGCIILTGFGLLPFSTAYLFYHFKKVDSLQSDSEEIFPISLVVGILGILVLLVYLMYSTVLSIPPPPPSPYHDSMWDINPFGLLALLLTLVYTAALVPYVGSKILGLGLKYQFTALEKN